ncbi:MAG: hypothetical protein O6948_12250 [Deltaproteobacteria bacterium]|nr:hypothetical protein [Deltaproteobacteria bacterium]
MKKITGVLILLIALLVPAQIIRAGNHEMALLRLEKLEKQIQLLMAGMKKMDKVHPDRMKKIEKQIKHIDKHMVHVEPELQELVDETE